jgi:hypothetical protein
MYACTHLNHIHTKYACPAADGSACEVVTDQVCCLQLWAGSMDGCVYVYDLNELGDLSNVRSVTHATLKTGVRALTASGHQVYGGTEDGTLFTLQQDSETFVASVKEHSNIVSCLCAVGSLVRCYSRRSATHADLPLTQIF